MTVTPGSTSTNTTEPAPTTAPAPMPRRGTTTEPGDIVLYSGDQIVIFYGSNSWSYTRLGRVAGATAPKMAGLLGKGAVTLTIYME